MDASVPIINVPTINGIKRGSRSFRRLIKERFDQSISGMICSNPRHCVPTHVLKVYMGTIVHGFVIYTPASTANGLSLKIHTTAKPIRVCKPKRGDIPIKTPAAKANAIL